MAEYGLHRNSEGYSDPTARAALGTIIREENEREAERQKQLNALIYVLKFVIDAAGFELTRRIELRDKKTGREYK